MSLRHNKKKNGKIVYEQLMVLATRLAITDKIMESKYVLGIVKEHYALDTMLGREKKLFDSILESKSGSKEEANDVITESLMESKMINSKKLDQEKVHLVNRVMKDIGKDLFSIPVKEYKMLASTQILFNETRNGFKYSNPEERVKIKRLLAENINTPHPVEEEDYVMDNFTYNILVKKFNEKYTSVMNEDQRDILSGWIDFLMTEDRNKFLGIVERKILKAKGEIDNALIKESHNASEYGDMLKEAREKLSSNQPSIQEEAVHEVMKYFDLIEDLREIDYGQEIK